MFYNIETYLIMQLLNRGDRGQEDLIMKYDGIFTPQVIFHLHII